MSDDLAGTRVAFADGGPPLKIGTVTHTAEDVTVQGDDGNIYRLPPERVQELHSTQPDGVHPIPFGVWVEVAWPEGISLPRFGRVRESRPDGTEGAFKYKLETGARRTASDVPCKYVEPMSLSDITTLESFLEG